jgi:hypothetical protein
MKLSCFAVAAALAVSSFAVSASTLEILEIDKGQTTYTAPHTLGLPFLDNYLFKLSDEFLPFNYQADVGFAFTELKFKKITDIDFTDGFITFSSSLDAAGNPTGTIFATGVPVPNPGTATLAFDTFSVNTKDFYMTIKGTVIGTGLDHNAGSYSFEIEAAPVPEPTTYSLALGGLALIGVATAKRRRVAAQAAA